MSTTSVRRPVYPPHSPTAFNAAVNQATRRMITSGIKSGILHLSNPAAKEFTPRMDIIDDPSSPNIVAIFELPGVKTSDISLHIREGNLLVQGERRCPHGNAVLPSALNLTGVPPASKDMAKSDRMDCDVRLAVRRVHELRYGSFRRSIKVPNGLKESEISAGIQDGMLTVTWPRSAGSTDASISPAAVPLQREAQTDNVTPPPSLVTAAPATAQ